jgi:hypothetical protein
MPTNVANSSQTIPSIQLSRILVLVTPISLMTHFTHPSSAENVIATLG